MRRTVFAALVTAALAAPVHAAEVNCAEFARQAGEAWTRDDYDTLRAFPRLAAFGRSLDRQLTDERSARIAAQAFKAVATGYCLGVQDGVNPPPAAPPRNPSRTM